MSCRYWSGLLQVDGVVLEVKCGRLGGRGGVLEVFMSVFEVEIWCLGVEF